MQTPSPSVESVFARSWDLLTRNWVLIVPGLLVGIALGILTAILTPPYTYDPNNPAAAVAAASARFARGFVVAILGVIAMVVMITYTTGMAGAAWLRGTATLADGTAAFQRDAGHVFSAMVAWVIVGIIAAILTPFTIGLSLLAFLFLFLYTMPAAVVGEHGGFAALAESYRIATQRFVPTMIVAVLIIVIGVVAGIVGAALHFAPFIGPIVSAVLSQAVNAYFVLVIVGEYLNLRGSAAQAAAGPSTTTP